MAKYKMLVGITTYFEVAVESDNVENAKNKINDAFAVVGEEGYDWWQPIREKVELTQGLVHALDEYFGIKQGTIKEVQETVTVVG